LHTLTSLPSSYKILDGLGEVLMDEKQKLFVKEKMMGELIAYLQFLGE
jgi:hypothetical protein